MQLFQQQYKIFGSFGASMRNIRDSLAKMADGLLPVIDSELGLADLEHGIARLESRQVFGKASWWSSLLGQPMACRQGRGRHGSWLRRAGRRGVFGFLTVLRLLRGIRLINVGTMANVAGAADAPRRALAAGAPHRPRQPHLRVSGEVIRRDRNDPARCAGTTSAGSAPSSPISTGCGTTIRSRAKPGRIMDVRRPTARRLRFGSRDVRRRLFFTAHLANWELAAVAAHAYGMDSTVLLLPPAGRCRHCRHGDRHARGLHGHADSRPTPGAPQHDCSKRCSAAPCRHAGRSIFGAGACR